MLFDALAAVQRALATVPGAWRVEIWLGTTLEWAQWRTGLSAANFVEADGGILLRTEVDDLERLARDLAGLGLPLVIRQPSALRTALRRYALALARAVRRSEAEIAAPSTAPAVQAAAPTA